MKYKRQLMTGIFTLTLMAGGATASAAEDFVPNSKTMEYHNQVKMRSYERAHSNEDQKHYKDM